MTHNNIITANNVIINYNTTTNHSAENSVTEPSQGPSATIPAGVHISGTGDMKITTDSRNASTVQREHESHPLSDSQIINTATTGDINAQIQAINNDSSYVETSTNPGPNRNNSSAEEEVMFVGRKVHNNTKTRQSSQMSSMMSKQTRVRLGQSLNNPSFNAKNRGLSVNRDLKSSAQEGYLKAIDATGNLKLSFSKKRSLKKP